MYLGICMLLLLKLQIVAESHFNDLRIAFGSCNDNVDDDSLWNAIQSEAPNLWVWLGDIVYVDSAKFKYHIGTTNIQTAMKESWALLSRNSYYQSFRESLSHGVIATWDDHDYGGDNLGRFFPYKEESRHLFLDALGYSNSSSMRTNQGVYSSTVLGSPGRYLKILLLDMRFNRDDYDTEGGDFLGASQWRWLINELDALNATDVLVLGSSIQLLPDDKPFCIETWSKFPGRRRELVTRLARVQASHVVILSGDIHFAEVNKATVRVGDTPVQLVEVTSSGLTHAWGEGDGGSYGLTWMLSTIVFFVGEYLGPFYYRERFTRDWFSGLNFGILDVSWRDGEVSVVASIRNRHGDVVIEVPVPPLRPHHCPERSDAAPSSRHRHRHRQLDSDPLTHTEHEDEDQDQNGIDQDLITPIRGRAHYLHVIFAYIIVGMLSLGPFLALLIVLLKQSFLYLTSFALRLKRFLFHYSL